MAVDVIDLHGASESTGTRAWKFALAAFVVFALTIDLWGLSNAERALSAEKAGTLGVEWGPSDARGLTIASVERDSPLAVEGAKRGDAVRFDHRGDRRRAFTVDETVGLTLITSTGARHLEVRPARQGPLPLDERLVVIMTWVGSFLMLLTGVLVGWRRADDPTLRCLAASLLSQTIQFFLPFLPGGEFQSTLASFVYELSFMTAYVAFAYFALAYTRSIVLRRSWGRIAFAVYVAAFATLTAFAIASRFSDWGPGVRAVVNIGGRVLALFSAATCMGVLVVGWRRSHGIRRQRLAWLCLCMVSIYSVYFGSNALLLLGDWVDPGIFNIVSGIIVTAANCGLGYAVLRHRILDFGFVVNRALVYATTSLILAASFILIAQLVNGVIHLEARRDSRLLDILIGLGLALSARQIVKWIDPKVQRIFFRRWHEAAAKLARFRVDHLHGTDADTIEREYVEAVREYGDATGVALYRADADGNLRRSVSTMPDAPAAIPSTHPMLATLLVGKPIDLSRTLHDIPGALALPMVAHGRTVGLLLVGRKRGSEAFRADETKALAESARQVGLALEFARLKALEGVLTAGTPQPQ